jgi:hypothetical protein
LNPVTVPLILFDVVNKFDLLIKEHWGS